jgi:hypothetical protein
MVSTKLNYLRVVPNIALIQRKGCSHEKPELHDRDAPDDSLTY